MQSNFPHFRMMIAFTEPRIGKLTIAKSKDLGEEGKVLKGYEPATLRSADEQLFSGFSSAMVKLLSCRTYAQVFRDEAFLWFGMTPA